MRRYFLLSGIFSRNVFTFEAHHKVFLPYTLYFGI